MQLVSTVNISIKCEQPKNDEVLYTTLLILNILQARMNDHFFEYFRTLHPYYGKPIKHLFL